MRVVLIKGQSAYDALRVFIDHLATAFLARGYEPVVIDLLGADPSGDVDRTAAAGGIGLVFTFNILGEYRDRRGWTLAQIFRAPHVVQYVDYPLTNAARLDKTAAETALLFVDESHVNAVRSVYGPERFAHTAFSPHAALGDPAGGETNPEAFAAARPIPILFTGSFYRPGDTSWPQLDRRAKAIFERGLDIAMGVEWIPALDALDRALTESGRDPATCDLAPLRRHASLIHEHVRSHRRFELLKQAAKLGLPVHVYGSGYEKHLYRFKNVTYGGEADLKQATALMARSRVVLNANANFGAGSHERPLSAMLAGAAAASDHSRFYASHFEPGREIALYRWTSLETDLAEVGKLALDPVAAFEMARAGQAKVIAGHRWDSRVDAILAAAQGARRRVQLAA